MSKYKGLFTFDVDNHRYLPVEQADGIIDCMNYHPELEMPKEPLIKDEKIRKAVRAWAEAFNVDVAYLAPIGDGSKFVELFNEDSDGFERIAIPAENIKQEQCYTIAELCGEEEETVEKAEEKEYVEVEITTREYDHAEAIKRATENLCGEEEE